MAYCSDGRGEEQGGADADQEIEADYELPEFYVVLRLVEDGFCEGGRKTYQYNFRFKSMLKTTRTLPDNTSYFGPYLSKRGPMKSQTSKAKKA